jgi:hypothetical protein
MGASVWALMVYSLMTEPLTPAARGDLVSAYKDEHSCEIGRAYQLRGMPADVQRRLTLKCVQIPLQEFPSGMPIPASDSPGRPQ